MKKKNWKRRNRGIGQSLSTLKKEAERNNLGRQMEQFNRLHCLNRVAVILGYTSNFPCNINLTHLLKVHSKSKIHLLKFLNLRFKIKMMVSLELLLKESQARTLRKAESSSAINMHNQSHLRSLMYHRLILMKNIATCKICKTDKTWISHVKKWLSHCIDKGWLTSI